MILLRYERQFNKKIFFYSCLPLLNFNNFANNKVGNVTN